MDKKFYQEPSMDIIDILLDEAVLQASNWGKAGDPGFFGNESYGRTYPY